MKHDDKVILEAFKIYSTLSIDGQCLINEFPNYKIDDEVRGLVEMFADEVSCVVILSGENLYMIPKAVSSPYHISNALFKERYMSSKYQVSDIYLMYFCILTFYGVFYDSYSTVEPIMDFVTMDLWLQSVNDAIELLEEHDEETLKYFEKDLQYNWTKIIEKWQLLDDINEKAKVQDGRTKSRLSFLNMTRDFLKAEGLIEDIGNGEIALTDKSMDIVGRYFMEVDYNRGILEMLYEGDDYADNIES